MTGLVWVVLISRQFSSWRSAHARLRSLIHRACANRQRLVSGWSAATKTTKMCSQHRSRPTTWRLRLAPRPPGQLAYDNFRLWLKTCKNERGLGIEVPSEGQGEPPDRESGGLPPKVDSLLRNSNKCVTNHSRGTSLAPISRHVEWHFSKRVAISEKGVEPPKSRTCFLLFAVEFFSSIVDFMKKST